MDFIQESVSPFAVAYVPTAEDQNVNGAVHGGVIFHLCDEAVGRYVTSLGKTGAAADADIHYYRPARIGERLTARISERKMGRRLGVLLAEVRNERDQLIADALFTIAFSDPSAPAESKGA